MTEDEPLLTAADLGRRWLLSRQRIHQMVDEGHLPPGRHAGGGRIRKGPALWSEGFIRAWEDDPIHADFMARVADRRATADP